MYLKKIHARVAFVEAAQHFVVNRFDRAGHEEAASVAQFWQMLLMLEKVFDLDGDVVSNLRKLAVQRFYKHHPVADAIEKIRITKRDVLRSHCHLLANIFEHNFAVHNPENTVVDGDDRAVTAKMLASAACLRVTRNAVFSGRQNDVGILRGQRKTLPLGPDEFLPLKRN